MSTNIVSFELAKLAEENGFTDQPDPFGFIKHYYHRETGELFTSDRLIGKSIKDYVYATSQASLNQWMINVKRMYVIVIPYSENLWIYYYTALGKKDIGLPCIIDTASTNFNKCTKLYKSYDEALEQGMIAALKHLA